MREGWTIEPLSEVCQIKPPKSQARKNLSPTDLVSFIPMRDLHVRCKDLALNEERPLAKVAGSYTYFANNDVLLAKITPCFENGKLGIARNLKNGVGFGSSEYIVFRSNGRIDPDYLFYFLSRDSFRDAGARVMTGAVGHKRVSKEFIETLKIPLPPLAEQTRIVALLDEAFAGIAVATAAASKNLKNARELFETTLNTTFTQKGEGWVETTLGEVCERLHQGLNTAGQKVKFYEEGYPIIQTRNINEGTINLDRKIKFMCEEDWILYKDKFRPEVGDVFFTNIGTIGKTAIVNNVQDYLIHWNIFKIRPQPEKITPSFMKLFLDSLTLSGYFDRLQKGGTVSFVTKKAISQVLICLPNLAQQIDMVDRLENLHSQTQRLEALYQQKIDALGELKQSLLQKAFAGELTSELTTEPQPLEATG